MSSGSTLGNGTALQDVQMKEALAELQLLQCWRGEDPADRMDLENPFKLLNNPEKAEEEDKGHAKGRDRTQRVASLVVSAGAKATRTALRMPRERSHVARPLAAPCRIVRARTSRERSGCSVGFF